MKFGYRVTAPSIELDITTNINGQEEWKHGAPAAIRKALNDRSATVTVEDTYDETTISFSVESRKFEDLGPVTVQRSIVKSEVDALLLKAADDLQEACAAYVNGEEAKVLGQPLTNFISEPVFIDLLSRFTNACQKQVARWEPQVVAHYGAR